MTKWLVFFACFCVFLSASNSIEKLYKQDPIKAIEKAKNLKQASKNSDEKLNLTLFLSNAFIEQKDFKNAAKELDEALKFDKSNKLNIYQNLAFVYLKLENKKHALFVMKKFLELKPNDKTMLANAYNTALELKNFKDAALFYDKLHDKMNEKNFINLASLYMKANDEKKALTLLEYAYKLDLLKSKNGINLYVYLLQNNDLYKKAVFLILQNQDFFDENDILNLNMAAKDYDEVIALIKAKKNATQNDKMLLAKVYFKKHDFKNSIDTLKTIKATKNSKFEGEILMLESYCYYYLNNLKELEKSLQKAISNQHTTKKAKNMLMYLNSL